MATKTEAANQDKLILAAHLASQFGKYALASSAGGHDRAAFATDLDKTAGDLLKVLTEIGYTASA